MVEYLVYNEKVSGSNPLLFKMYTIFIIFIVFNLSFAGLFGKQLSLKIYLFVLFMVCIITVFNQELLANLDFFFKNQITQILTVSIYKEIKVSFVIFLALVILLGLNFNNIVGKFADFYFLFLISVFNQQKIPYKFISLTTIFGSFIGRQISIYLDLSIIKAFLLMFSLGLLTCLIIYGILVGFFILGTYYAKLWGNAVFSYLLKKASPSVQQKLKPKNTSPSAIKKISRLSNSGPLKNQYKRRYSSGKSCLGILDKLLFCFSNEQSLSTTNSNNLDFFLNKIDINSESHKDNLKLIAKSLEKSSISAEQKTTILSRASDSSDKAIDIINNLNDVCSKGVPALDKTFNSVKFGPSFAQVEMNSSQAVDLTKSTLKTVKGMGPSLAAGALGAAALGTVAFTAKHAVNSKTLDKSLKTATEDFFSLENLGSFDSNKSSPDRFAKLKKHHSSNF